MMNQRMSTLLLALLLLAAPGAIAQEDDAHSDEETQQEDSKPCAVSRQNPDGALLNKIIVDPDGCWRAFIQENVGIGREAYKQATGG